MNVVRLMASFPYFNNPPIFLVDFKKNLILVVFDALFLLLCGSMKALQLSVSVR